MSESPVLPSYATDQWNDFKFDLEDRDLSPETSLSSFEGSPAEASWDYFPYDGFHDTNFSDPLFGKEAVASEDFNITREVKKEPCLSPSALLDLSWSQDVALPSAEAANDFALPLSNEEQANLLAIAMGRNNDFTLPLSPMSSYPTAGSVSSISSRSPSPQPRAKPVAAAATQPAKRPATRDGPPAPKTRKCSHNAIEKRYRMNLNERILALQNSLPALRTSPLSSSEEEMGVCRRKRSKAAILTGAIEYIAQLEKKNKRLSQQLSMMQTQWKPRV
ncbi:hypothetical protein F5884DRAFT_855387 [Xylogone sp. PMI_703]|nr:hypothetical protein F5884DRAFT_855387 [Xylogone sp. PMI_703]